MSKGTGKTRPFTDAHAIVSVDVAVGFDDELGEKVFRELESSLGSVLASMGFIRDESSSVEEVGVHLAYERKSEEGEVMELVHVHPNYAHAQVLEYRGWELTRDRLVETMQPIFKIARSSEPPSEALFLSFTDAFINDDPDNYEAVDVFKQNVFLPSVVFESGDYWEHRLRTRFIVNDTTGRWSNIYSRLSIDAGWKVKDKDVPYHVTEVKHRQGSFVAPGVDAAIAFEEQNIKLRLDLMHEQNRKVMLQMLSDEMLIRIGLEKEASK